MDQRLHTLENDYMSAVSDALRALEESGIAPPSSNLEWALRSIPGAGLLVNGAAYRKHGYGCSVSLNDMEVDFDFGPSGEIEAPDAFRLMGFCGERLQQYGFASSTELEHLLSNDS
jgi:hypothetical protein